MPTSHLLKAGWVSILTNTTKEPNNWYLVSLLVQTSTNLYFLAYAKLPSMQRILVTGIFLDQP